jgi:hypothetical protein
MSRGPHKDLILLEQLSKGLSKNTKVSDEFPIITCQTEKPTEFSDI